MEAQTLGALKRKCKSLEAIITRSESQALHDYIAGYDSYFPDYQSASSFDELVNDCVKADIVYIGDYHLLRFSQEKALELLNEFVKQEKKFILCLEMVMAKHQPFIDAYLKRKISEKKFLAEINYCRNWPFEWKNFKPFFDFARRNQVEIKGIGCRRKTGAGPHKAKESMAKQIAKHAVNNPVAVIAGEAHLCPAYLPAEVNNLLKQQDHKKRSDATILQDYPLVYWKLAERDLENKVAVTKLQKNVYNITNTSPLMRLREEFFYQNGSGGKSSHASLCMLRDGMIKLLIKAFHLPKIKKADYPKLLTSLNHLETEGIEREEVKAFEAEAQGGYRLKSNVIYLVNFSENGLAEECAHFVNYYFNKEAERLTEKVHPLSLFYMSCLAEAIAHFSAKVIMPNRFFDEAAYKKTEAYSLYKKHIKCEKNYKEALKIGGKYPLEIFQKPGKIISEVLHLLGYRLGEMLYKASKEGKFFREEARELIFKSFEGKTLAVETYFTLVERLA